MKYIKLTIILLLTTGVLAWVIFLITNGTVDYDVTIKPTNVKTKTIEKRIQDEIESASNNSFCPKAYEDILKTIDLFFAEEPSNRSTYTLMLQGAYCRKFVQQTNHVFDGTTWKGVTTIRKELRRCLSFFPNDPDLSSINNVISEYDKLVKFDERVIKACQQSPKCLTDDRYLYKLDDWDVATTEYLLSNIPNVSGKVINSPKYRSTRLDTVKQRLKTAHTSFIEQKMEVSERAAKSYNYNPNQFQTYRTLGDNLVKCFDTYYGLWQTSTSSWRQKLADWERYVTSLETDNY